MALTVDAIRWLFRYQDVGRIKDLTKVPTEVKDLLVKGLEIALKIHEKLLSEITFEKLENTTRIKIQNTKTILNVNYGDRSCVTLRDGKNQKKTAAEALGNIKELFCLFSSMLHFLEVKLKCDCFNDGLSDFPFFSTKVEFGCLEGIEFTSDVKHFFDNSFFVKTLEFINDKKTSEYLTTAIKKLNNAPQGDNTVDLLNLLDIPCSWQHRP